MGESYEITVIIPVYKADKNLLQNAITSVNKQLILPTNIMFVVEEGSDDYELVKELTSKNMSVQHTIIQHTKSTSFPSQMNIGVEACDTEWFVFLEQDDELANIWVKNVVKYRNVYTDVNIFLPLIIDINIEGRFIGMANEPVWASEFSEELGVLDNDSLLRYQNFNFCGMAMRTEAYKEFGGLKESIKLAFMYEFLLRLTNFANKTMVIPKFGYKHLNLGKGSLGEEYSSMSLDESRWWLATAKKEYFHIKDRDIQYENIIE